MICLLLFYSASSSQHSCFKLKMNAHLASRLVVTLFRTLSNLSSADDIAVISNSRCELQTFLHLLAKYEAEVGLKINFSKTKCMTTDKITKNLHLTIDNNEISQVTEFIHLGHKLSSKNDGLVTVQHRIALGWASFNKNKAVLTSKRVSYHLKSKIFNTHVMPVVRYGLECVD